MFNMEIALIIIWTITFTLTFTGTVLSYKKAKSKRLFAVYLAFCIASAANVFSIAFRNGWFE